MISGSLSPVEKQISMAAAAALANLAVRPSETGWIDASCNATCVLQVAVSSGSTRLLINACASAAVSLADLC